MREGAEDDGLVFYYLFMTATDELNILMPEVLFYS